MAREERDAAKHYDPFANYATSSLDSQKKTFRACERDSETYQQKRELFLFELSLIPKENRTYLDEAGSNLAMSPFRAWAPRNERAYDKKPSSRGTNISMVGAIKETGMQTVYPYDGAVDTENFLHFLETKLLPKMTKNDVLIMDNCRTHHSKIVKARLQELQIEVLYMPPYSPELNPIEEAWSVIKGKLRRRKARSIPEYVDGLLDACASIDSKICKGFFRHAEQFGSLC